MRRALCLPSTEILEEDDSLGQMLAMPVTFKILAVI
jgi:hypothetical protein